MKNYIIGIDGGGTKTAFVLALKDMTYVSELTLPRSNPADIGLEKTCEVLKKGIKSLCENANIRLSDIAAVFAGIAGVCSNDGYISHLTSFLSSLLPEARVKVDSDGTNPLYAAFPFRDGVAVICGTGSSCFVKKGEKIIRIGGYGLFDGKGNGFEIGKEVVNHALRVLDGRDRPSKLSDLVLEEHGDLIEGLGDMIAKGKSYIASFAPPAFECFDTDEYAREIVVSNAAYISELIDSAAYLFDGEFEVAVTGGIGCNDIAFDLIKDGVRSKAVVTKLGAKPVAGAVARAKMLLT